MKPIKDEVHSAIKTTPLIKHKSLASLKVPSSTSTSTGWCDRNSITRASRESKARIFPCVLRLRAIGLLHEEACPLNLISRSDTFLAPRCEPQM